MPDPRQAYSSRMQKVLDHVEAHLDAALDLHALAAIAHFSPYHFHRLFQAWRGERLGEYVRRRRLEVAAERLIETPSTPVLDIALGVGFQSSEAFSRAFKLRFGRKPSEWRAADREAAPLTWKATDTQRKLDQSNGKHDQSQVVPGADNAPPRPSGITSMASLAIEQLPVIPIAYLRHTGPYGAAVSRFWRESVAPWLIEHQLHQGARFGIAHDDPSLAPDEQCRYDAAVECSPDFALTAGEHAWLPGGRYAVLPFEGRNPDLVQAWLDLLGVWLPGSGLELDERPCFEHYPVGARFDPLTGIYACRICIPVADAKSS